MAQYELASRNCSNHALEHRVGLCHERPVPGIKRPFTGGAGPPVARGQYIQQRDLTNAVRMVKRQAMRGARPPVVTGQEKAVITERAPRIAWRLTIRTAF